MTVMHIEDGDILTFAQSSWPRIPTAIPVNTEGVAGAGLARQWARLYPYEFYVYQRLCAIIKQPAITPWYKADRILVGKVIVFKIGDDIPWVMFPTKNRWIDSSNMEYIRSGLVSLRDDLIIPNQWSAIALPAFGCGISGIKWKDVSQLVGDTLAPVGKLTIHLFQPRELT